MLSDYKRKANANLKTLRDAFGLKNEDVPSTLTLYTLTFSLASLVASLGLFSLVLSLYATLTLLLVSLIR
jgi:hypothetical protein